MPKGMSVDLIKEVATLFDGFIDRQILHAHSKGVTAPSNVAVLVLLLLVGQVVMVILKQRCRLLFDLPQKGENGTSPFLIPTVIAPSGSSRCPPQGSDHTRHRRHRWDQVHVSKIAKQTKSRQGLVVGMFDWLFLEIVGRSAYSMHVSTDPIRLQHRIKGIYGRLLGHVPAVLVPPHLQYRRCPITTVGGGGLAPNANGQSVGLQLVRAPCECGGQVHTAPLMVVRADQLIDPLGASNHLPEFWIADV
mmetsp:Transcript_23240/g.67091  ORF Transcript_23240/g.67091 Transcript_23240/m.67091 type:complete len:248 (-) Transcript_23240:425-1168(-)